MSEKDEKYEHLKVTKFDRFMFSVKSFTTKKSALNLLKYADNSSDATTLYYYTPSRTKFSP